MLATSWGTISRSAIHQRNRSRTPVSHKLTAVPDLVDAVSDNGRIVIDLPGSEVAYAVRASADNGKAEVDVPTDSRSTHVVKARADNGEVTVRSVN